MDPFSVYLHSRFFPPSLSGVAEREKERECVRVCKGEREREKDKLALSIRAEKNW